MATSTNSELDYRPSYRKAQADDAWKLAVDWFKANGVG